MSKYRVVQFTESQEYINACKPYDDTFINFAFGAYLDYIGPVKTPILEDDPVPLTLLAVYSGEQLIALLAKVPFEFAWMLSVPTVIEESLSDEDFASAASMLPPVIAAAVGAKVFTELFGPKRLTEALLKAWKAHMDTLGIRIDIEATLGTFSRITYATKSSVALPSPAHAQFKIKRAMPEDIESLVPLYIDFVADLPQPATREAALGFFNGTVKLGRTWMVRIDDQAVGYCVVARLTPHTASIRTVYVSPKYRRRGIAQAMTIAVTRFYLGAEPFGMDVSPPTPEEVRDEVGLGVIRKDVERLYKRCGYLSGRRDPGTGKIGWVDTAIREIRYED